MPDFKLVAIYVLAALCLVLGLSTVSYRTMSKANAYALAAQNAAIKQQQKDAAEHLRALNASVLAQQTTIDQRAEAQEKRDDAVRRVLAQAARDYDDKPVVVRVRGSCWSGGGAQQSPPGAAPDPRAGDTDTSAGVLAPAAERRLKSSIADIELLQAAFNSCRERMMTSP